MGERAWDEVSRETGEKEGRGVRLEHQEGLGKDFDVLAACQHLLSQSLHDSTTSLDCRAPPT